MMAEGRRLLLEGKSKEAMATIAKATRAVHLGAPVEDKDSRPMKTSDAKLSMLHARVEIDLGRLPAAVQLLNAALDEGGLEAEIHCVLAWLYAAPPEAKFADAQKALRQATIACELTRDGDWLCLAALAAAHARRGDFAAATAALERARQAAPEHTAATFDAWNAELASNRPLTRDWKLIRSEN
jgi:tetratricopeptide (TPR) repeat protein